MVRVGWFAAADEAGLFGHKPQMSLSRLGSGRARTLLSMRALGLWFAAVPLCRTHHRELHRAGRESDWWSKMGIEPLGFARELWLGTRPLPGISALQENSKAARS